MEQRYWREDQMKDEEMRRKWKMEGKCEAVEAYMKAPELEDEELEDEEIKSVFEIGI
ncbi:hypothetical protein Csa_009212 [Cucumis sativus]|uniref:Uncharacterized protein n=1 Tax=Cucumis sativus TaxID=3659 RepID=A0A0A0KS50_CUCSA|nr:hypothetical protein Csa_009212 [Cucumis sativus]